MFIYIYANPSNRYKQKKKCEHKLNHQTSILCVLLLYSTEALYTFIHCIYVYKPNMHFNQNVFYVHIYKYKHDTKCVLLIVFQYITTTLIYVKRLFYSNKFFFVPCEQNVQYKRHGGGIYFMNILFGYTRTHTHTYIELLSLNYAHIYTLSLFIYSYYIYIIYMTNFCFAFISVPKSNSNHLILYTNTYVCIVHLFKALQA